jgi:hypothetical protein
VTAAPKYLNAKGSAVFEDATSSPFAPATLVASPVIVSHAAVIALSAYGGAGGVVSKVAVSVAAAESVAGVVSLVLVSTPAASAAAQTFATHASPALQVLFG